MDNAALSTLQAWLKAHKKDAMIIPMNDRFQNEYLPAHEMRIQHLTGFTGSEGTLVVTQNSAFLSVDSRYTEQAFQQVDREKITLGTLDTGEQFDYLEKLFPDGFTLSFDPWLHTIQQVKFLEKRVSALKGTISPLKSNPINDHWKNRPSPHKEPAILLDLSLTGEATIEKSKRLAKLFKNTAAKRAFIGDVTASNWVLNIRGQDLDHTPVLFNYTFLNANGSLDVVTDISQVPTELRTAVKEHVLFYDWSEFETYLKDCDALYLPAEHAPHALLTLCQEMHLKPIIGHDFYSVAKATKNPVEIQGMQACHIEDGLAVTRFLYELSQPDAPAELTEQSAASLLEQKRRLSTSYLTPSFPTISAVDAHAALPHYRVTDTSDAPFQAPCLYLVDSGGQYLSGTTDITRTVYVGEEPTPKLKTHFTLVLKGHIALASCHFPQGTTGVSLDALARQFLWNEGLDFGHGTGHGVGFRLNVHEAPPSISPRASRQPLLEGMVVSNEPGYYKPGAYGIRIENLMVVEKSPGKKGFLCFKTLSLAPIDKHLIEKDMLTLQEKQWLNQYHERVFEAHAPFLTAEERAWLEEETAPLS